MARPPIQLERRVDLRGKPERLLIPLGTSIYSQKNVPYVEKLSHGVTIIEAIARYGKSIMVGNIMCHASSYRPIIILDYLGEHTMRKYPNFLSRDQIKSIPLLEEISGFRFKISQYPNQTDWKSMGYSDQAAELAAFIARHQSAHQDNPQLFLQIIEELPEKPQQIEGWIAEYGISLQRTHSGIKETLNRKTRILVEQEFFAGQQDITYDFGRLALENKYLNINMNLHQGQAEQGRTLAGKVLEQIMHVIQKFNIPPLFIIEEADVLAPNYEEGQHRMSSQEMLIKMTLKLQKQGIELVFIVQDATNLHYLITQNWQQLIVGANSKFVDESKYLRWNDDLNYREFLYKRRGMPGYETIVPHDSTSLY